MDLQTMKTQMNAVIQKHQVRDLLIFLHFDSLCVNVFLNFRHWREKKKKKTMNTETKEKSEH